MLLYFYYVFQLLFTQSKMFCCSRKLTIPVISLHGIISPTSKLSFKDTKKLIDKAFDIPFIKVIALNINSPGGSPVQSELIFNYIRRLAKEKDVQIITFIGDCAASGGYYLACTGDEIYASNSSIVGSIGVIASGFGFNELIKKIGVERRIYTQGQNKSILDPFLPEKQSDVDILNDVGKDIHQEFIRHVQERRGARLCVNDGNLFTGKFWSGKAAKEKGLIDGTDDMYSVLESKYGKNIDIKFISENKGLLGSIRDMMSIEMLTTMVVESVINVIKDTAIWARVGV
jgi:signal peptide peptidase SppA